ncbi:MAG TPA: SAM-dependent methyltransferase [Verrucomicrobiae bacterium]|nr:SAM-dependent methyltransferase [Verrucomicrobiae bacterium]
MSNSTPDAVSRWVDLARDAWREGTLVKLTLGDYRGGEAGLKNLHARPVTLPAGPRLSFVYRHATRDITKNLAPEEGFALLREMLGREFHSAHLFTTKLSAELRFRGRAGARLILGKPAHAAPADTRHDRARQRAIPAAQAGWLRDLAVTTGDGQVAKGMEAKFRQINKFVELLGHQIGELDTLSRPELRLVDMGCGKGYLTFAAYTCLTGAGWPEAKVTGIEARAELVELCNRAARENGLTGLRFEQGTIEGAALEKTDVLVALHACDTATDDALAKGIQAGAAVILAAPCCHKELRPRLVPPPALASTLRHGILRERQAEFVTDALRAALLEWAGYETRVFEFISPEHTSKNLMIVATRRGQSESMRAAKAEAARQLAGLYGIREQRLAGQLNFSLSGGDL